MLSFPAIRRLALSCAVTVVCALALAPTAGADARNLLSNPDFEAPRGDHPWMPAAWDTSRGNTEMVFFGRDAFSAHAGQYGVGVANASATMPLWHNWSQTVDVTPDMWGKDMVLTVWTRNNGVDGRGYVCLQAFRDTVGKMARVWKIDREMASRRLGLAGVNDPQIDLTWKRESFAENETEWVQRTLRAYLPPTTTLITVRMGLFGTGQVMFDDASLTLETAATATVPPLHTNVFRDPGFEGNTLAWELSTPPYPPIICSRDTTYSHSGKACMHFNCENGLSMGRTGVGQVICNRALSGKRLRLSAYAKAESLGSSIYVHLFSHTKTGFERASSSQTVYGTMDWTKLSVESDIPEDTYEVWAWIEYSSPVRGHAYFDDASLEVVGPATGRPTSDAVVPDSPARGSTRVKSEPAGKRPTKP
jgi:hypothetical protein